MNPGIEQGLRVLDNSTEETKLLRQLWDWIVEGGRLDVATGNLEIGALTALDGAWQNLERLRILMGDQTTRRTREALLEGIQRALDQSLEQEKEKNDFLTGVPAVISAIASGQIQAKVFSQNKFHAKAYIRSSPQTLFGTEALVGSSNFSYPGLVQNVELNVVPSEPVDSLQAWYDTYWNEAEDIAPDLLKVIERHTQDYPPFLVYAKALQEFFRGHELTASEWEQKESKIYPLLAQYQREGYHALMKIARDFKGGFLCDGVGLGKTFIGLMVIERLIAYERKRVVLLVPKATRKAVWDKVIAKYLPHIGSQDFSNLVVFNHTDLSRDNDFLERLNRVKDLADAVVIDEAHNFRNPGIKGTSRYWKLYDLLQGKETYLLTATPINNSLLDFQHLIELFSQRQSDYFARKLGIHTVAGHFRSMEKALEQQIHQGGAVETDMQEAGSVLFGDELFRSLVVQRSRAYVRQSLQTDEADILFPERQRPQVTPYSLQDTYGSLLNKLEKAFDNDKPLFSLAMYYPYAYYKGDARVEVGDLEIGRKEQVVGLIRTQFLKRFESSVEAFGASCERLLIKLLTFATKLSSSPGQTRRLERWGAVHDDLMNYVRQRQNARDGEPEAEDLVTPDMLADVEELDPDKFDIDDILAETFLDMDQMVEFIKELRRFDPSHDSKVLALVGNLKTHPLLSRHKVLIFTEFADTARYLEAQLSKAGFTHLDRVDGDTPDRVDAVERFAPYYNDNDSAALARAGKAETRVLISTDVLAEGLNLQDATLLINYDLHWNPVRLMQRIGRVDRRLSPETEAKILADHPEQREVRATVHYWNFLPPGELDQLLKLYKRVAHKTLRISKIFGLEGKQLLTPEDDYEALKDFNHSYEGSATSLEQMRLRLNQMLADDPSLEAQLDRLPGRVFSGKAHPRPGQRGVFFCYALPGPANDSEAEAEWSEEAGKRQWYFYDLETGEVLTEPTEIDPLIVCEPPADRLTLIPQEALTEARKAVEKQIKNTYLKQVQAPMGVKGRLVAWMELN